jgi:hypothetical protein
MPPKKLKLIILSVILKSVVNAFAPPAPLDTLWIGSDCGHQRRDRIRLYGAKCKAARRSFSGHTPIPLVALRALSYRESFIRCDWNKEKDDDDDNGEEDEEDNDINNDFDNDAGIEGDVIDDDDDDEDDGAGDD